MRILIVMRVLVRRKGGSLQSKDLLHWTAHVPGVSLSPASLVLTRVCPAARIPSGQTWTALLWAMDFVCYARTMRSGRSGYGLRKNPHPRGGGVRAGHLGRTETQRGRLWTACGQRCVDSKNSQTTPATTSTSSVRQLLGAADTQTAHHATFSTVPTHQLLGSANAETTPARAPAAAAGRKQRPDATCEGKNGRPSRAP